MDGSSRTTLHADWPATGLTLQPDPLCPPGSLLLVLCLVMAGAVLSASFAVFLVRERESRSKAVQVPLAAEQ